MKQIMIHANTAEDFRDHIVNLIYEFQTNIYSNPTIFTQTEGTLVKLSDC